MKIIIRIRNQEGTIDFSMFRRIAMLVDRPEFLNDLSVARKFLNLENLIPINEIGNWEADQQWVSDYSKYCSIVEDIATLFWGSQILKGKPDINTLPTKVIYELAYALEKKYKQVGNGQIIKSAILTGVINSEAVKSRNLEMAELNFVGTQTDITKYRGISNIERDRDWYWRNKAGEGYEKISKSKAGSDKDAVGKAIKAYKKFLFRGGKL